jgi:hypothetical protein
MNRERALKVVLVVVGLIFSALVYPLTMFVRQEPALAMMLSLYAFSCCWQPVTHRRIAV